MSTIFPAERGRDAASALVVAAETTWRTISALQGRAYVGGLAAVLPAVNGGKHLRQEPAGCLAVESCRLDGGLAQRMRRVRSNPRK